LFVGDENDLEELLKLWKWRKLSAAPWINDFLSNQCSIIDLLNSLCESYLHKTPIQIGMWSALINEIHDKVAPRISENGMSSLNEKSLDCLGDQRCNLTGLLAHHAEIVPI
jgi:hypothetical protein